jgi:hypothetical protein
MAEVEIIFVYNADSSLGAKVFDFLHKAVSPETYECNLCRVTYGVFAERKEWREFIRKLPFQASFLYRDQFAKRHPQAAATPLPAIFLEPKDGQPALLASAEEINCARTVGDLKALVAAKLQSLRPGSVS